MYAISLKASFISSMGKWPDDTTKKLSRSERALRTSNLDLQAGINWVQAPSASHIWLPREAMKVKPEGQFPENSLAPPTSNLHAQYTE